MLRHIVLFRWKPGTPPEKVRRCEEAFCSLPAGIPEIADLEWGTDVSVEGIAHGFTHGLVVSFASEADRDTYLPHPDHTAFVSLIRPHLADLLVLDYHARTCADDPTPPPGPAARSRGRQPAAPTPPRR